MVRWLALPLATTTFGPEVEAGLRAVKKACAMASRVQASEAMTKADASPVTIADFAAQAMILSTLKQEFPADGFIAEETSETLDSRCVEATAAAAGMPVSALIDSIDLSGTQGERTWILDPIDGTKGFLRKEQYCVALCLCIKGVPTVSVLGCPNLEGGTLAVALKNYGAFCFNKQWSRLRVSQRKLNDDLVLVEGVSRLHSNHDWSQAAFQRLTKTPNKIRLDSQAKAVILAQGKADCFIRLPKKNYVEKIWDAAPASLLVEEAGGRYTDRKGNDIDFSSASLKTDGIIATNGHLHLPLVAALEATEYLRD